MEMYLSARTVSAIEFLKSSEEEDYSKQVVGTIASTNEMMGPALDKVTEDRGKIYRCFTTPTEF